MDRTQYLVHYGILGQKWGIRRYENPDGTLTEAGKERYQKKYPYQNPDGSLNEKGQKDYMKAAKKGKLDYSKLSDKDLDMINNRFTKEKNYARNVQEYQDSRISNKIKKAVVAKITGSGGNGGGGGGGKGKGGKGGKGGGGSALGKLLMMPIESAFKEAFSGKNGGGDKGGAESQKEKGKNWIITSFKPTLSDKQSVKALRESDVHRGESFIKSAFGVSSEAAGRLGSYDSTDSGNSEAERRLRERRLSRNSSSYADG